MESPVECQIWAQPHAAGQTCTSCKDSPTRYRAGGTNEAHPWEVAHSPETYPSSHPEFPPASSPLSSPTRPLLPKLCIAESAKS
ncbi:hypothetical protein PtB15_14B6 [Puccinia triticina]|nr:hypothetical protein PtB15_14B6 [Puccinia triticina]